MWIIDEKKLDNCRFIKYTFFNLKIIMKMINAVGRQSLIDLEKKIKEVMQRLLVVRGIILSAQLQQNGNIKGVRDRQRE